MVQKADTPTGIYSDLKWKSTGDGTDYDTERYGPNDLLALTYKEGEAKGSGRSGILLHGGRSQFPELVSTHGCIRIADEDIAELQLVTDIVSFIDPNDKPENVYVENDLQESVTYQERTSYKKDTEYFITLDEIIVYPKKEDN